jgi:hypothetical protein
MIVVLFPNRGTIFFTSLDEPPHHIFPQKLLDKTVNAYVFFRTDGIYGMYSAKKKASFVTFWQPWTPSVKKAGDET